MKYSPFHSRLIRLFAPVSAMLSARLANSSSPISRAIAAPARNAARYSELVHDIAPHQNPQSRVVDCQPVDDPVVVAVLPDQPIERLLGLFPVALQERVVATHLVFPIDAQHVARLAVEHEVAAELAAREHPAAGRIEADPVGKVLHLAHRCAPSAGNNRATACA